MTADLRALGLESRALLEAIEELLDARLGRAEDDNHAISTEEAATYLGIGINRMYELVKTGELAYRRAGNGFAFHKRDLNDWIARDTVRELRTVMAS